MHPQAQIRAFDPSDYEALARILCLAYPSRPSSAERERDSDQRARYPRRRWTAGSAAGPLGFAEYQQNHFTPPGCYMLRLAVDPQSQGRGIGAALFLEVLRALQTLNACELRVQMPVHYSRGVRFFQDRGFAVTNTSHRMRLDLARFPFSEWRHAIAAAESGGYRFLSVAEWIRDQAGLTALWRLHAEAEPDIPIGAPREQESPAQREDLEAFRHRVLANPSLLLEQSYVAAAGPVPAGVTEVSRMAREGELNTNFTGVARAHRGRSLSLPLKLLSMQAAHAAGHRYVHTNNHQRNAAMLRINERLGFEKQETVFTLARGLPGPDRAAGDEAA